MAGAAAEAGSFIKGLDVGMRGETARTRVRRISKARSEAAKKRYGKDAKKKMREVEDKKMDKEIQKETKKAEKSEKTLESIIDSITC